MGWALGFNASGLCQGYGTYPTEKPINGYWVGIFCVQLSCVKLRLRLSAEGMLWKFPQISHDSTKDFSRANRLGYVFRKLARQLGLASFWSANRLTIAFACGPYG